MKYLYSMFLALLAFALPAFGQANLTVAEAVTADTPLTVLDGGKYAISTITFWNYNTTNVAVLKFYDSTDNSTSQVVGAHTTWAIVNSTNTSIYTNAQGLLITNIQIGVTRESTSVGASTNQLPRKVNFAVSTSADRTVNVSWQPALGATILSTTTGLVEIGYRQIAP
jgi:hypothetical protein